MTAQPTTHRLDVPGGTLYYEVRGSGPLLLVIGQPMTSGPFGPLADLLAEDHTVGDVRPARARPEHRGRPVAGR